MIHPCRVDASYRIVRNENPDLDISLLSLDEVDVPEYENEELYAEARHVRSALVARVADIMKKAANEPSALDSALATVEVLVSTYCGGGERPGRGHKHAMQAIQLLAVVQGRLNDAMDFFFDLVERYCMYHRGQGRIADRTPGDQHTDPTMQNYDQTMVKLISKHWDGSVRRSKLDVQRPLERIEALRHNFAVKQSRRTSVLPCAGMSPLCSTWFSESEQLLRSIQQKSITDVLVVSTPSYRRMWQWKMWSGPPCVRAALAKRQYKLDMAIEEARQHPNNLRQPEMLQVSEVPKRVSRKPIQILDLKDQIEMEHGSVHKFRQFAVEVKELDLESQDDDSLSYDSFTLHDEGSSQLSVYHAI